MTYGTHEHPAHGENAAYDAQQEMLQERKRAFYKALERKIELERDLATAEHEYASRLKEYRTLIAKAEQAKEAMLVAERQRASIVKEMSRRKFHENSIRREEAEANGEKTYMTGTPCKNGHYARRYTSSGACVECDKIGWRNGQLKSKAILTETPKE